MIRILFGPLLVLAFILLSPVLSPSPSSATQGSRIRLWIGKGIVNTVKGTVKTFGAMLKVVRADTSQTSVVLRSSVPELPY
jgi:hypothetical protein